MEKDVGRGRWGWRQIVEEKERGRERKSERKKNVKIRVRDTMFKRKLEKRDG